MGDGRGETAGAGRELRGYPGPSWPPSPNLNLAPTFHFINIARSVKKINRLQFQQAYELPKPMVNRFITKVDCSLEVAFTEYLEACMRTMLFLWWRMEEVVEVVNFVAILFQAGHFH